MCLTNTLGIFLMFVCLDGMSPGCEVRSMSRGLPKVSFRWLQISTQDIFSFSLFFTQCGICKIQRA